MNRLEAIKQIEDYAEDSENGNYHDFAACLRGYASIIEDRTGNENLILVKSIDEFPIRKNIEEINITEG